MNMANVWAWEGIDYTPDDIDIINKMNIEHANARDKTFADPFKDLSFHHDELDTRNIFYGDWQYDTVHDRVARYQGECAPRPSPAVGARLPRLCVDGRADQKAYETFCS
ncbi:hypothetical protein B5807_09968 [Epicoccum nigrum]|uniref:Uncharacterized protein n=1 Tax=Epicoccum nigrum TaxID=105696 RepID=A0A1Y2LTV1_EPING|nr:hypothetical protein B5807_09968 [Epicoccum nigrum]